MRSKRYQLAMQQLNLQFQLRRRFKNYKMLRQHLMP